MIKTLAKNIKGFVKESVLTPFFMILEVVVETIIPFLMSSMIDDGINKGDMQHILITGGYSGRTCTHGLVCRYDGRYLRCKSFGRLCKKSQTLNVCKYPVILVC